MKTVKYLQGEIAQKQGELAEIFTKAKKDDGTYDLTPAQVENIKTRNDELTALGKELDEAKMIDETYQRNAEYVKDQNRAASNLNLGGKGGDGAGGRSDGGGHQSKTVGELFTEHESYKNRKRGETINVSLKGIAMKTLMTTSAGYAPQTIRSGKEVGYAVRRLTVADLIPNTDLGTEQAAVKYMEETTFTNNADTVAEGGEYPESADEWTERTEALYKIAHFLPVTEEQLRYVPQSQSIIDNRLTLMLRLAEELKLLTATGGGSDIDGYLHKSGVQEQARGSDSEPDAFYKGITKVRATGFAEPDGFIINPTNWQNVRLLQTTDGIYIWGSPAEAGPERLWGLTGIITTAITLNTGLVGDFGLYSEIFRGGGIDIKVSDSHSDYFIKGKLAIKATEYLALAIYRAAAYCKVTSLR